MVYEVASMQIAPGKAKEAREWGKEIGEYTSKKYGFKGQVVVDVVPGEGRGSRITWISTFESLSSWASFYEGVAEDSEFQRLAQTSLDSRIPSTFTRAVYRTI